MEFGTFINRTDEKEMVSALGCGLDGLALGNIGTFLIPFPCHHNIPISLYIEVWNRKR